jgi:hypothetical protein
MTTVSSPSMDSAAFTDVFQLFAVSLEQGDGDCLVPGADYPQTAFHGLIVVLEMLVRPGRPV